LIGGLPDDAAPLNARVTLEDPPAGLHLVEACRSGEGGFQTRRRLQTRLTLGLWAALLNGYGM